MRSRIKFITILISIILLSICCYFYFNYFVISKTNSENLKYSYSIENIDTSPRGEKFEINDEIIIKFDFISDNDKFNDQTIYLTTNFNIKEIFVNNEKTDIRSEYKNSYILNIDIIPPKTEIKLKGNILTLPTILKIESENNIISESIYLA